MRIEELFLHDELESANAKGAKSTCSEALVKLANMYYRGEDLFPKDIGKVA